MAEHGVQMGTQPDRPGGTTKDEPSVAELVKQLSEQSSALARKEVELAKLEVTEKAKRTGIGAGMFGGAGMLGVAAFGALTACDAVNGAPAVGLRLDLRALDRPLGDSFAADVFAAGARAHVRESLERDLGRARRPLKFFHSRGGARGVGSAKMC